MSREIKFRAWDEGKRKMLPLTLYKCDHSNDFALMEEPDATYIDEPVDFVTKDTVLMQFTGLRDKNNKEIYEGDIVRRKLVGNTWKEKGVVKFESGSFVLDRKLMDERDHNTIPPTRLEHIEWPMDYFEDCEVIGNIHENPELMEGK